MNDLLDIPAFLDRRHELNQPKGFTVQQPEQQTSKFIAFFQKGAKALGKATVADIERVQTDQKARQLVLDAYHALRRFMKLCEINPDEPKQP